MTNYPNSQDNNFTLPGVSGVTEEDIAITALREATFAIEKELGIVPSGVYSDVRARFDILEARINSPASGIVLSDGYTNSPFFIVNSLQAVTLSISDGYGIPTENRINGSIFMRADGYANNELYVRRIGAWFPVQSDLWVAGGDLSGTYTNQTVIGIRGKSLNVSLATIGSAEDGYHLTWNNSITSWQAETGFIANGDLAILNGPFGRTGQTVVRLQGRVLASTAPGGSTSSDGDGLAWDPSTSQWQPRPRAIIFDGYVGRSNLRSNKILQSPTLNTKVGIVNFGSRSTGSTVGAIEDYSAILSGNRNSSTNTFSLVIGGDSNTASGQYGTILNGLTNTASEQYSFILDGYSNTASGINSFILSGGNNTSAASFSGVLNGLSNTITSASTHAGIGFGSSNAIAGATSTYTIIMGGSGNTANGQNIFLGNPTNANVASAYSTVISGLTNIINASSNFSFIGAGNANTLTGAYATILNGNTNSVTGSYAIILDGYSNTVSGSGSFIGDGYSNTVSGFYSSILNGNNNSISSLNSTILNGSSNVMGINSPNNIVLFGTANTLNTSTRVVVAGNGNQFTGVTSAYILGQFNNVQGGSIKIAGDSNTIGTGSNFNRIFGNSNTLGANSVQNNVFGANNFLINGTNNNVILGSNNILDTINNGVIIGSNNNINSNFGMVAGQFGMARLFGQQVQANSRFTSGTIGQAQWSRLVLTGTANSGAAIQCLLQDSAPTPPTFVDGYSYDMHIRVLVVNTLPISPNPVVPARFAFDVLVHQEAGTLIIDNINQTINTTNTFDDPAGITRTLGWSVSLTVSTNQLQITVNPETSSANYVQPTNTPSNRRAIATIEMREITRL